TVGREASGVLRGVDGRGLRGARREVVLLGEFVGAESGPALDAVGEDVGRDVGGILDGFGEAVGEVATEGAGAVAGVAGGRLVHVGVEADQLPGDLVVRADRIGRVGSFHPPTLDTVGPPDNPRGSASRVGADGVAWGA